MATDSTLDFSVTLNCIDASKAIPLVAGHSTVDVDEFELFGDCTKKPSDEVSYWVETLTLV